MKVVYTKRVFFPSQAMDCNFQIEYHVIEDYNLKHDFAPLSMIQRICISGIHFHICTHIIVQIPIVKHLASLKMCCIASYPSHRSNVNNTALNKEVIISP